MCGKYVCECAMYTHLHFICNVSVLCPVVYNIYVKGINLCQKIRMDADRLETIKYA